MANPSGYDAPTVTQEDDALDRWRFAADVFRVAKDTPADWSVRLGVFAKWGEGKTTVLRFVEQMAIADGYVPVRFAPWSAHTWDDLWAELATVLVEALEKHDAATKSVKKLKYKLLGKKAQKGAKPVATELGALNTAVKASVGVGFSLLQQFLDVNGSDFQNLHIELGDRRVIVFIDDLDRADPRLVPQLLLALRELLDLPGFIFVLAFDDQIVSDALTAYHSAWKSGESFLEKIIDFRFVMPRPTAAQIRVLFERSLRTFCPFIGSSVVDEVVDLLPLNPRKAKALIRHLIALKEEVLRHDADELNWVDIVIAQLLRLESEAFFDALLHATPLGDLPFPRFAMRRKRAESAGKDDHELELDDLLEQAHVSDPHIQGRIRELMEAQRSRGSLMFRSQAELHARPQLITWKEFRECLGIWTSSQQIIDVERWIREQANRRSTGFKEVAVDFYDLLLRWRESQLEGATEVQTTDEHRSATMLAQGSLTLIREVLLGPAGPLRETLNNQQSFAKLFDHCLKWVHFDRNPGEPERRDQERQLLIDFIREVATVGAREYLDVLRPWSLDVAHDVGAVDAEAAVSRGGLRAALIDLVAPEAADAVLKLFEAPGGIRRLSEKGKRPAEKYILFGPRSPLRIDPLKTDLLKALQAANTTDVGRENCLALFELALDALSTGVEGVDAEDVRILLRDQLFVTGMWDGAVSRRIQYRRQLDILRGRARLIASGASETAMPVPDWLKGRLNEIAAGQRPTDATDDGSVPPE